LAHLRVFVPHSMRRWPREREPERPFLSGAYFLSTGVWGVFLISYIQYMCLDCSKNCRGFWRIRNISAFLVVYLSQ
jgi:hypothetical protein